METTKRSKSDTQREHHSLRETNRKTDPQTWDGQGNLALTLAKAPRYRHLARVGITPVKKRPIWRLGFGGWVSVIALPRGKNLSRRIIRC